MENALSPLPQNFWQTIETVLKNFRQSFWLYAAVSLIYLGLFFAVTAISEEVFLGMQIKTPTVGAALAVKAVGLVFSIILFLLQSVCLLAEIYICKQTHNQAPVSVGGSLKYGWQNLWPYIRIIAQLGWYAIRPTFLIALILLILYGMSVALLPNANAAVNPAVNTSLSQAVGGLSRYVLALIGILSLLPFFYRLVKVIFGAYALVEENVKTGKEALVRVSLVTRGRWWWVVGNSFVLAFICAAINIPLFFLGVDNAGQIGTKILPIIYWVLFLGEGVIANIFFYYLYLRLLEKNSEKSPSKVSQSAKQDRLR